MYAIRSYYVDGDVLTVEIADNLSIKVNRSFVSGAATAEEAKGKK